MYFVTSNQGKFVEIAHRLSEFQLQQYTIEYPELQTDTLETVVQFGLTWLKTKVDSPFIIEDAGLFVEALNGFPGVYSAYVFRTVGNQGILRLLEGTRNRTAAFKSVLGLYDGTAHVFEGVCHGRIAHTERGSNGFGYDPIFIPAKGDSTFGEMAVAEKNLHSHRGKAASQLLSYLRANGRVEE